MDTEKRIRDAWIALRCQSGEIRAFDELVTWMERPLLYYATKLTGSEERALDVLQDVWIKAFRGIRKLKDPSSLRSWLYHITHGVAVDSIRHNAPREQREVHLPMETLQETEEPSFSDSDAAVLHEALDDISPSHRDALVLHFLEGFSIAEIARITSCSEGTVKSRIHYAKREIKQILLRGGYANRQ